MVIMREFAIKCIYIFFLHISLQQQVSHLGLLAVQVSLPKSTSL